jgi:hypothetical protein
MPRVQALTFDASLTDFAPAIGSNFSAAWRRGASADGDSLISFQQEGCITERWTFGKVLLSIR